LPAFKRTGNSQIQAYYPKDSNKGRVELLKNTRTFRKGYHQHNC